LTEYELIVIARTVNGKDQSINNSKILLGKKKPIHLKKITILPDGQDIVDVIGES